VRLSDEALAELRAVVPDAECLEVGDVPYVFLPRLKLPPGNSPVEVDGLLRLASGPDGYQTRLLLAHAYPSHGQNWTVHTLFGKTWHTPSFNGVPADLRPIEVLCNHLAVYR
jgi:hypothetical protein